MSQVTEHLAERLTASTNARWAPGEYIPLPENVKEFEWTLLADVLEHAAGYSYDVAARNAAHLLGISYAARSAAQSFAAGNLHVGDFSAYLTFILEVIFKDDKYQELPACTRFTLEQRNELETALKPLFRPYFNHQGWHSLNEADSVTDNVISLLRRYGLHF